MSATNATSAVCAIVRESFEAYRRDSLPGPQRKMFREHLAACADCRAAAAENDPAFRFARAVSDEVSSEERAAILSAVRTGVELLNAQRRLGHPRPRRMRVAAAAAAAAVAALILLAPGRAPRRGPSEPDARVAADSSERLLPTRPAPAAASAGLQSAALPEASSPATSDATVYDWNPGAGREEPRVVWIVDRGLDI